MNQAPGLLGFLRNFSLHRVALAVFLTTVATAIIKPYFNYELPFWFLWVRLSIVAVVMLVTFIVSGVLYAHFRPKSIKLALMQFLALVVGAVAGTVASGLIIGRSLSEMVENEAIFWGMVIFSGASIALGVVTATVLVYREEAARAAAEVARADAQRHELEKQVLEARLKLMQAQIEPHFLFNTLANVQHLVEANPPLAAKTLESLITYLRAALPEMREGNTRLGREADMAKAYLDIQQLRMGSRLKFSVAIPAELRNAAFPPMMLMTLVENSIKHGIDPLQQGGEIHVRATRDDAGMIDVSVADSGQGLSHSAGMGIGLQNIRERLMALYGKTAKLILEENPPQGVVAHIQIATSSP
ncbi:MAG: histidine kinase [Betaproteobacteria bacterium]